MNLCCLSQAVCSVLLGKHQNTLSLLTEKGESGTLRGSQPMKQGCGPTGLWWECSKCTGGKENETKGGLSCSMLYYGSEIQPFLVYLCELHIN